MTRSIQFYLPPDQADALKAVWRMMADDVIPDSQSGQRGTKASRLFQLICLAAAANYKDTQALLEQIKNIHDERYKSATALLKQYYDELHEAD